MIKSLIISTILAATLIACVPNTSNIDKVAFQKSFDNCTAQGLIMGSDEHKQCTFRTYAESQQ